MLRKNSFFVAIFTLLLCQQNIHAGEQAPKYHGHQSSDGVRVTSTGQGQIQKNISDYIDSTMSIRSNAAFESGEALLLQPFTQQNVKMAFSLFEQSAKDNHPGATFYLGVMSERGIGVSQDIEAALKWYEKAAKLGVSSALFNMGKIYEKGIGIKKDPKKAADLYMLAAENKDHGAMSSLGVMYATGSGLNQDKEKAFELFCRAAALGDVKGMQNLGLALARGFGVDQNEVMGDVFIAFANEKQREVTLGGENQKSWLKDGLGDPTVIVDVQSFFRKTVSGQQNVPEILRSCN